MRALLRLFALCALAMPAAAEELAPLPSDLLQRVREAYGVLGVYRDRGEIRVRAGDDRHEVASYFFTTELSSDGAFRFALTPGPASPAGDSVTWNRELAARSGSAELPAALVERLGPAAPEALVVAALLAGGPRALRDPEAIALDGEEACGAATCWRLQGARDGGALRFLLWIDETTARIHRVEVEDDRGSPALLEVALAAEVVERRGESRAENHGEPATEPGTELPVFGEQVVVRSSSIQVRVLDRGTGDPVRGLSASDFRLRVGDREIPVAGVEWVSSSEPVADAETLAALAAAGYEAPSPGKLVVFFVQADLQPSRMIGQLRTLPEAKRFLDTLGLDDRIAVVSFDSHLKLRLDFTTDRAAVRDAFDQAMVTGPEPWIRPRGEPSLARRFDFAAARAAAVPESGLAVTARALIDLPGDKTIVFVGWGLGRFGQMGVEMIPEYDGALAALAAAKASVFALDVTDADYHSLEEGLKQVARDTGGQYIKTMYHPKAALARLSELVAGFYRISFAPPADAAGESLRVELRDRKLGEVVAPRLRLGESAGGPGG